MRLKKGSFGSLFCVWVLFVALVNFVPRIAVATCAVDVPLKSLPKVTVKKVLDGDTVTLEDGRSIRFIGVNTPEIAHGKKPAEPLGNDALAFARRWEFASLYLQIGADDKDRYGRTLGHLFDKRGNNLTAELLRRGLGFPVTVPPNTRYAECYWEAADEARRQHKGVWREPYHRVRTTSAPGDVKAGFGRYRGKIAKVVVSRKKIWIELFGDVSIVVNRNDRQTVQGAVLQRILVAADKGTVLQLPQLEFSGWVQDRMGWGKKMRRQIARGTRKRWQLTVRFRRHWQFAPY